MTMAIGMDNVILREWLQSGRLVRICGLDMRPKLSPHWPGAPQCITKGQATVVFLEQRPQANMWLIKIFRPGCRPANEYLHAVEQYLPGAAAFLACMQRRFLTAEHLDQRASSYQHAALPELLEGAVKMPKVPDMAWATMADDLRSGALKVPWVRRLKLAHALARCIDLLEAAQCSHRDLSAPNIFLDGDKVWLIDFDCLYHPSLPFQANTTIGTMGYIAPFLKATSSTADPALSWSPCADRFSLAILITELLLAGPDLPGPHEDGTLFSQSQIDQATNPFVHEIIGQLKEQSKPCGLLLERAFAGATFQQCPSPQEWIGALRWTLHGVETGRQGRSQTSGKQQFLRVRCTDCEAIFSIPKTKHDQLRQKGKSILCKPCLSRLLTESSVARAQRRLVYPEVSCEHCQERFSLPRHKLQALRHRGKPILCPACLPGQLAKWRQEKAEYDSSHTLVACATCKQCFRLRKELQYQLIAKKTPILCPDCLSKARNKRIDRQDQSSLKKIMHYMKLWLL